ncbi:unnamed protein product [Cyclocybe aegerita]|uniref:Uncharacterized protein n=1 Tax=Cyclocybe aegerita TaxID=1973307 RepID=A0A8S0VV10_CYCAE|nr:unnamed protein product [Cyclocybe aegerita]
MDKGGLRKKGVGFWGSGRRVRAKQGSASGGLQYERKARKKKDQRRARRRKDSDESDEDSKDEKRKKEKARRRRRKQESDSDDECRRRKKKKTNKKTKKRMDTDDSDESSSEDERSRKTFTLVFSLHPPRLPPPQSLSLHPLPRVSRQSHPAPEAALVLVVSVAHGDFAALMLHSL